MSHRTDRNQVSNFQLQFIALVVPLYYYLHAHDPVRVFPCVNNLWKGEPNKVSRNQLKVSKMLANVKGYPGASFSTFNLFSCPFLAHEWRKLFTYIVL